MTERQGKEDYKYLRTVLVVGVVVLICVIAGVMLMN